MTGFRQTAVAVTRQIQHRNPVVLQQRFRYIFPNASVHAPAMQQYYLLSLIHI